MRNVPEPGPTESGVSEPTVLRRFILLYIPFAFAWIYGTDLVVARFAGSLEDAIGYSLVKGTLFVVLTIWFLYLAMRRSTAESARRHAIFRGVVEDAPDLILRIRLTPEFGFEYVSPSALELGGYSPREYYESPELILRSVHPDDAAELADLIAHPDAERRQIRLRFVHRVTGATVWTEIRVAYELDGRDEPVGLVAVSRDITAQVEAEYRSHLLTTAIEAAGEAVVITGPDGTIEYVNSTFTRLSGFTAEEAVGKNPRLLKSGRQSERFYARLWSTIRSGRTFRGHFVNRRKDGTLYEQQSTITPVPGEDGKPAHFVAVSRDVTVEREIHRQIAESEKAVAVAQVAAGIAHDFRNLLSVVLVNVEALKTSLDDASASEASRELLDIEAAVAGGSDLVTRLLHLARPTEEAREAVSLARLVNEMHGILRAALTPSIELALDLDDEARKVEIDRPRIEQALLNLVRNASEAMPEGGVLTVRVGPAKRLPAEGSSEIPESFVQLTVQDTGSGMTEEELAKVYVPFFTTKDTGTGLGVPMVRRAVEQHGGTMEMRSEPGVGTEVSLYLPVSDEPVSVDEGGEGDEGERPGPRGGSERILLVEDDSGLRKAAERVLKHLGYAVTAAENGLEAIHLIEGGEEFDLILSDLIMPILGGAELYERLQERGIRTPVVFMSGHRPELVQGFSRGGSATAFVAKPWSTETLSRAVRGALDA